MPAATTSQRRRFTRASAAKDTNTDIQRKVDSNGWSLFTISGDVEDVEADMFPLDC